MVDFDSSMSTSWRVFFICSIVKNNFHY
uniref:Uncharacterized protein n=1 Tax=Anguilla anguilla TaxID=7936 RepID=A0A0E9PJM9_ANGAN